MKRKTGLLILLLIGLTINIYGQKTAKTLPDRSQRARAAVRASSDSRARAYVNASTGIASGDYIGTWTENEKRVSLNLSKHFEDQSISSKADFEVSEGQKAISLSLSGSCRSGEINISIVLPGGGTLENLTITSAADVHWSTMIPIKDEEKNKYIGKWKLEVNADKATGNYNLNISSR